MVSVECEHNGGIACVYPVSRVEIPEMIVEIAVCVVACARRYRGCGVTDCPAVIVHTNNVIKRLVSGLQPVIRVYNFRTIRHCRNEVVCLCVPERRVVG